MVCDDDEYENEEDNFSSVPNFTVVRFIMCITERGGYHHGHFGSQNTFLNRNLDRSVYTELPKLIFGDELRASN